MALGNHSIGSDVASTFAATSGIGATADNLLALISGVMLAAALIWCGYYLRRVFAAGFGKADVPYIVTGAALALILMFLVLSAIGITT